MNEMQQFGEATRSDCETVAEDRFGELRPDQSSSAQFPQKIGLKTPQAPYQAGAGDGLEGLQTVCTVARGTVPAGLFNVTVHPEVVPVSNPPLLKQFGVPMHGTVAHGVNVGVSVEVPEAVRVRLMVHVLVIVLVLHGVHVRESVGGHVIVGVGVSGTAQQILSST